MARPFELLDECAAAFGDCFTLDFARFGRHVFLSHPDDVRAVFSGDREILFAGRGNRLLEPILGMNSLLLADGEVHARQRAIVHPAFRQDQVRRYGAMVVAAVARWAAQSQMPGIVRMQRAALEISKDVILRIVLGADDGGDEEISRAVDRLMRVVGTNATFAEGGTDPRLMERFRSARAALDAALQCRIERRRDRPTGDDDLLALLLAAVARGESDDAAVRDQLVTMILAGHETTASSVTWALLCLAENPDVTTRLSAELEAAERLSDERLAELPYLQAVCLETLRIRPVVPVVSRELQAPFRLRAGELPAGVYVTPCAYLAQRRRERFPDASAFRPERFLETRFSPYEYFPFGGGVHRCLGMGLALLEMQIVVGMLMRRFHFETVESVVPVRRAVTIVASGEGKLRLRARAALAGA